VLRKRQPKRRVTGEQAGDPAAALTAAVALLARRDFHSTELSTRLLACGFEPEAVRASLEDLRERHYLDDERFVRQLIASHARRGHGPVRIRHELSELGVSSELTETALADHGGWSELAQAVRTRRFGAEPPRSWPDKARQARFLQYRGFSYDDIRFALGSDVTADS
jgi:regulatory protein